MDRAFLLSVGFHDGTYHGAGDWPPGPARLFQALVASAAKGDRLTNEDKAALEWLETLEPPVIAAPATRRRDRPFKTYVPNNDLDAVGGDLRRIADIRTGTKSVWPHIFDSCFPLLYIWKFNSDHVAEDKVRSVCAIAERLYQLGRGVDMAWAWAELLEVDEIEARLALHGGIVFRPSKSGNKKMLLCPQKGSLAKLIFRFKAIRSQFTLVGEGKKVQQLFSQPSKPRFAKVAYDSPAQRLLFELRSATSADTFVPWVSTSTVGLVTALRDKVVGRLKEALPDDVGKIDSVLVGRGATEVDKAARVRILPLPSIGHRHADHAVRRILVEVPPNCPLRVDELAWAFSGVEWSDPIDHGVLWTLIQAAERGMLDHYGIGGSEQKAFRVWRTITPVALPVARTARRTTGAKRVTGEARAARSVLHALRHAGVSIQVESIRVQREPFDRNGARAEEFANERFGAPVLHHVEITFAQALHGPLVIGNGRYLGLGLMAPRQDVSRDALVFSIASGASVAAAAAPSLLHAVRRALMALSRDDNGHIPRLFSGHERDGAPARSGSHDHVFLCADDTDEDGIVDRLIVAGPWECDHTRKGSREERILFDSVVSSLVNVRAGRLGIIALGPPRALEAGDRLVGPGCVWESRSAYRPTRHASRGKSLEAAVLQDVMAECGRRGLPEPAVEVLEMESGPGGGRVAARVRLRFAVAVSGPIMLGHESHRGGGLFATVDDEPRREH